MHRASGAPSDAPVPQRKCSPRDVRIALSAVLATGTILALAAFLRSGAPSDAYLPVVWDADSDTVPQPLLPDLLGSQQEAALGDAQGLAQGTAQGAAQGAAEPAAGPESPTARLNWEQSQQWVGEQLEALAAADASGGWHAVGDPVPKGTPAVSRRRRLAGGVARGSWRSRVLAGLPRRAMLADALHSEGEAVQPAVAAAAEAEGSPAAAAAASEVVKAAAEPAAAATLEPAVVAAVAPKGESAEADAAAAESRAKAKAKGKKKGESEGEGKGRGEGGGRGESEG